MIFDAYAFLEKLNSGALPLRQLRQTPPKHPPMSQMSQGGQGQKPEKSPEAETPETCPHGLSFTGNPLTWTGRMVSPDEWRAFSEWERHGSTGKMWNGITRRWETKP